MEDYIRKKMDVSLQTQQTPNMRVMSGKALLDDEANDFKFVENAPRGARSVEVGRTPHSRFVRRPDGLYTVTFRCDASSRYLREELTAEVADIVKAITEDRKLQQKIQKNALKEKKSDTSSDVCENKGDTKGDASIS